MQAVLSGRAALAFLSDGANWHSIHYDDLDQLVPRQPAEFDLLFQGVRDLDCLDCASVPLRLIWLTHRLLWAP